MRRTRLQSLCAALCVFGISTASAAIISINFDTDPTGAVIPAGTNLTTDATYAPWGVYFLRVGGSLCGPDVYANSNHPGDFGSLPNVVTTCPEGIASDISAPSFGQVRAEFTVPASQVCIDVRPDGPTHGANLAAHELGGTLVDSQNSTIGVTETLCVNGIGISYVLFNGPNVGYSRFDDMVITNDGAAPAFSVEGTVSGLTALGLVLQNNGVDDLDVFTNGNFLFDTRLDDGSAYAVTVLTSPPGQICNVTNGSGTITGANVTDVIVNCADDQVATYTVGGTVSGLTGSVTLQNNGGDDIIKTTNDGFTFPAQAEGTSYAVTVSSPPTGQTCTVANGSGTNITANITNATVTCVTDVVPTYSVGGTVSGLTGTGLALQNNGAEILSIAADGPFTFLTELVDTTAYTVIVSTQPTGQTCTVTNGSGAIAAADVTNVSVACADDVAPAAPVVPIPTMSQWALILFSMLLGLMVFANRRHLF